MLARRFQQRLHARSVTLLTTLDVGLDRIMVGWLLIAALACAGRLTASAASLARLTVADIAPYLLLVLAPIASALLALRWFHDGDAMPRSAARYSGFVRWLPLDRNSARQHHLYGTSGLMASLLLGMLLNVPVRAAEYLVSIPPVPGIAPQWLATLHLMMSFDVVLFTSLYVIAFVAGLRRAPLFPLLLMSIWAIDLLMQLGIAKAVGAAPDLPPAVGRALCNLLDGNAKKTLISVAVWFPYLILSTRVNVTFRHRIPA